MSPEALARLVGLRHALHRMPELSGHEAATADMICRELRAMPGWQLHQGVGGHGVLALYDSGVAGPTVALRCELDGLPIQELNDIDHASQTSGQGHLCGHDGHMVMVLGAAHMLMLEPPRRGRILLIFQPAEETGKGAGAMRADPVFATMAPDMVFALHNLPGASLGQVEICQGAANCASRGMRIMLAGKTSHAAEPEDGRSPAAALARLLPGLDALGPGGALDENFALTTVTHAVLGRPNFGIAPGEAEIWVTLRTVTDARMRALIAEAEALARDIAKRDGLGLEISYDDVFEACTNAAPAVDILQRACARTATPCTLTKTPQRFSEDFGQFAKGARTAMFWLGAGQAHPQLHNPDYDFPDALIPTGAALFDAAVRLALEADAWAG